MSKYDVIIIGSGLGGLICGQILSKEGHNVCIVEKHHQIGGCLQTFKRDGCVFDTGMHYIGGLDEGQPLHQYFKFCGLMDKLNLRRMDDNAYEVIGFDGDDREYKYANGADNFARRMIEYFPKERDAIMKYSNKMADMCSSFPMYNIDNTRRFAFSDDYYRQNAYQYVDSITKDKKLQNVLFGTNIIYAGVKEKTPLYVHALINNSFLESSWRPVDGSAQIATILADSIISHGGRIITKKEVTKFNCEGGVITSVELGNNERLEAKNFISNIRPGATLEMLETNKIRNVYRKRITSLDETASAFCLYLVLKKNSFKYINSNYYHFKKNNVWNVDYSEKSWPEGYVMMTPASSKSEVYADSMVAMSYMKYSEVKKWEDSSIEARGDEYREFKAQNAELFIDEICKKYPDLKQNIKKYYAATPLTLRDYLGYKDGALYGILRDCNNPMKSLIYARTKIPNLFFTGQNIDLHGALGVTIGAVVTCSELLGLDYLVSKIKGA
ncbi:phytoene desaturase family protein [Thermodesulfobacteriota bacterium]